MLCESMGKDAIWNYVNKIIFYVQWNKSKAGKDGAHDRAIEMQMANRRENYLTNKGYRKKSVI